MKLQTIFLLTTALLAACLDTTTPIDDTPIDEAPQETTAAVTAPTWHGILLVATDYQSASLSIVDEASGTISDSEFLHSGSVTPQLATFLSGDLVAARSTGPRNEIAVIDRKNSSLNFIDARTHALRVQYSVGEPEYGANPYDYVSVSDTIAYVPRYGIVFDDAGNVIQGNDILVLNPEDGSTIAQINLADQVLAVPNTTSTTYARPNGVTLIGSYIYVMLENQTLDFKQTDAQIVIIDTQEHTVAGTMRVQGLRNCSALVYASEVSRAYTACGGQYFDADRGKQSAVLALDVSDPLHPEIAYELDPADIDDSTYMSNTIALIAPDVVGLVFEGITDWGTGDVLVKEAIYAADVSASADAAVLVYEGNGAYILNMLGDPAQQRLYVSDAVFGDEKVTVFDANLAAMKFKKSHTIAPGKTGLPVRSMVKY